MRKIKPEILKSKILPSKYFFLIVLLYLLFGSISLLTSNPHLDEIESHIPTLKIFIDHNPIEAIRSTEYSSASTPLPYIIVSIPYRLTNSEPGLLDVRIINMVISFLSLLIFLILLEPSENKTIYSFLILFFYPYFLKTSFAFFMAIYGLLFILLFFLLLKNKSKTGIFLSGLALSFAILSQQFYLVVAVFYLPYFAYRNFKVNNSYKIVISLLLLLLPLSLILIAFIPWHGLTHPNYSAWGVEFSFTNLTAIFTVLGSVMLPFTIFLFKKDLVKPLILLSIAGLVLVLYHFPLWVSQPTAGGITGYTFHTLAILENMSRAISLVAKTILVTAGLLFLYMLVKIILTKGFDITIFLFIVLALGFSFNALPSERHFLPMVVIGLLLAFKQIKQIYVFKTWSLIQIIIGSVYFYYIMFAYSI